MTVALPPPVALPSPPGSPEALGSVLDRLGSAGYAAGLAVHLLEPAASLAGWQGADAAVAAAEVGATMAVAADLHEAITAASARLTDHHELWLAVRARVDQLREEQRARFADAGARLAVLAGLSVADGVPVVPPEARALVDAVAGEEVERRAEHRALLATLAEDAAGAAAGLAAASGSFGAADRAGAAAAVTARLAVELPGWGTGALAALGRQAAGELTSATAGEDFLTLVARWRPYAAVPGFADALVGRLGPEGLTWLLSLLAGPAGADERQPLAELLASVLGGAGSPPGGQAGRVLDAVRLDPDDPDGAVDGLAAAMGLVLTASGAGSVLAAVWGRQVLAREAARGVPAAALAPAGDLVPDPVEAALAALDRSGDTAAAALLLDDPDTWTTLLSRPWPRGTGSLAAVVRLAADAPRAGRAARSALLALGRGLAPGSPDRVLDDAGVPSRVRQAVAGLVAGQAGVVLPVLDAAAVGGALDADGDTALRGLGRLVADDDSATTVTAAVRAALQAGAGGESAGEVAGAHVALLEYGQRVGYALDWAHAQSRAVDAQIAWTFAVSAPVALLPGPAGEVAGVVEDVLADVLDANGDVEIGPDTGRARTGDDAAEFAARALPPAAPGAPQSSAAAARLGFDRVGEVLGRPTAPEESLLDRLSDLSMPDLPGRRPRNR